MDYCKLRNKLKETLDDKEIDIALAKISMFHPDLEKVFEHYIETGEMQELSFDGWNFEKIKEKIGCNELQAFFNMDTLMKNDAYRKYFKYMNFGKK